MNIKNMSFYNNAEFVKYFEIGIRRYERQMLSQRIKKGIANKRHKLEQLKLNINKYDI